MIKRVSRIFEQHLVQQHKLRFSSLYYADEEGAEQAVTPAAEGEEGQQTQQAQGSQVVAQEGEQEQRAYRKFDKWQRVKAFDSNWPMLAKFLNTKYYMNDNDSNLLQAEVNARLEEHEDFVGFDINNLSKLGIHSKMNSDILKMQYFRNQFKVLSNPLSPNTQISSSLFTANKIFELIKTNNIQLLWKMYRNRQFNENYKLQATVVNQIFQSVSAANYTNSFMLNLIQFVRYQIQEDQLAEGTVLRAPTKVAESVLRNLPQLQDVNKLAFCWIIGKLFATSKAQQQLLMEEVIKVNLEGQNQQATQKILHYGYHAIIGQANFQKVITFSLDTFKNSYTEFLKFWAVFNLLVKKVAGFKIQSLKDSSSLNDIFKVIEANFSQNISQVIITKMMPQILHETKNSLLFEFYRKSAQSWLKQRQIPNPPTKQSSSEDKIIHQAIQNKTSLTFAYNGWKSSYSCNCSFEMSTSRLELPTKITNVLSEAQMIEQLIKGEYNTVLNYFLSHNYPNFQKLVMREVDEVIKSADNYHFEDQNSRALFLILRLKELLTNFDQPVHFEEKYFGVFKEKNINFLLQDNRKPRFETNPQSRRDGGDQKFLNNKRSQFDEFTPSEHQQKIFHKPKKYQGNEKMFSKKKAEFNKPIDPTKNMFSTQKTLTKSHRHSFATQKDSYEEYKSVVKQVTNKDTELFSFSTADMSGFKRQALKKSASITQSNHLQLLQRRDIPIVGSGENLIKYLFLSKSQKQSDLSEQLRKSLQVEYESSIGTLEKDYSQYLKDCKFNFPLSAQFYISLLKDLQSNYIRKSYKVVVTHMIAYRESISEEEIDLMCDIAKKNKVGITLVQIFILLINRQNKLSRESVYKLCDTLQKFKVINKDIFFLAHRYCKKVGLDFEIKMMSSYIKSLLIEQDDLTLGEFCQTMKAELRPAQYKVNSHISADENIKIEKEHKKKQTQEFNKILFEIIDTVVVNIQQKLPVFLEDLFNEYQKSQVKLSAKEKAVSLIVYCNQVERFLQILRELKHNTEEIIPFTYECWLIAGKLNMRGLQTYAEEAFNVTLFTHNFMLSEDETQRTINFFKGMKNTTVFIKFLEYCLRYNPPMNQDIRHSTYTVMNSTNDDFAKNTISGLLDFIFNTNREKEREEYRKNQIIEQEKIRLLKELQKKPLKQQQIVEQDILQAAEKSTKAPKSMKQSEKQKAIRMKEEKQAGKVKVQNLPKRMRHNVRNVQEDQIISNDKQQALLKRPTSMPAKQKSKTLQNFMDMFASRQIVEEDPKQKAKLDVKGKGKPGKEKAEKGTKKK